MSFSRFLFPVVVSLCVFADSKEASKEADSKANVANETEKFELEPYSPPENVTSQQICNGCLTIVDYSNLFLVGSFDRTVSAGKSFDLDLTPKRYNLDLCQGYMLSSSHQWVRDLCKYIVSAYLDELTLAFHSKDATTNFKDTINDVVKQRDQKYRFCNRRFCEKSQKPEKAHLSGKDMDCKNCKMYVKDIKAQYALESTVPLKSLSSDIRRHHFFADASCRLLSYRHVSPEALNGICTDFLDGENGSDSTKMLKIVNNYKDGDDLERTLCVNFFKDKDDNYCKATKKKKKKKKAQKAKSSKAEL